MPLAGPSFFDLRNNSNILNEAGFPTENGDTYMLSQNRTARTRVRPFAYFEHGLYDHWRELAESTKNAIQVRTLAKGDNYDVNALIKDVVGELISNGAYNSQNGIHAEIAALDNCRPIDNATLSVSPPPCKRCAAILAYYRTKHSFTIYAPSKDFAATYTGAYFLPDFIKKDIIIAGAVEEGVISEEEALHHADTIAARFCTHSW
jgi:hypothetical protein